MESLKKFGWVEAVVTVNFLVFLTWWQFGVSLMNSSQGLVWNLSTPFLLAWIITAIPGVLASVYGLANLNVRNLSDFERERRAVVCVICLVANAVALAAMIVPNSVFVIRVVNLY